MSTVIRPELSETNRYWISKHRYYELKHFCLQYSYWKTLYNALINYPSGQPKAVQSKKVTATGDPVGKNIDERLYYINRIDLIERIAKETDSVLSCYILEAVTKGVSYDYLKVKYNIPCCKDVYYDLYRRFFWLLSKERQ